MSRDHVGRDVTGRHRVTDNSREECARRDVGNWIGAEVENWGGTLIPTHAGLCRLAGQRHLSPWIPEFEGPPAALHGFVVFLHESRDEGAHLFVE